MSDSERRTIIHDLLASTHGGKPYVPRGSPKTQLPSRIDAMAVDVGPFYTYGPTQVKDGEYSGYYDIGQYRWHYSDAARCRWLDDYRVFDKTTDTRTARDHERHAQYAVVEQVLTPADKCSATQLAWHVATIRDG
ncbi:hypothetical protein [Aurantimonas coralicida]|uniref:hypothetical protein n=1 Tax=Aurantimonas coralicida TaxID=182270 RepID=UPI001E3F3263|nr:hypothetical protein [Aurantimonas coralicida]MCD1642458.1 hypothetical protein [Aurantimonas coralicida]